ncbi:MAG: 7-carboxy-7-deazaguanine synthase QueE, partial [Planctomycetota bacterium]
MSNFSSNGITEEISDIFSSIQGEGVFVGRRFIFVRFRNCNLNCAYCDTPRKNVTGMKLENPQGSGDMQYFPLPVSLKTAGETIDIFISSGIHEAVSLTGGEPLLADKEFLRSLLKMIKEYGVTAYVETNGTLPNALKHIIDLVDHVCMDIKIESAT